MVAAVSMAYVQSIFPLIFALVIVQYYLWVQILVDFENSGFSGY